MGDSAVTQTPESDTFSPAAACLANGEKSEAAMRSIFPGDSEMARRMRAFDWAASDFGQVEHWPENLRIGVRLCLTSRFPILIWWGANYSVLYNDAYIPFLAEAKHPRYLGQPGRECWKEIWETIGPMLDGVYATGQATWSDEFPFFFDRRLPREEVYVRFTYGPILASDGQTVQGVFCPCTEITEQVVGARRLETLRRLGVRAGDARTVEAACKEAAVVMSENSRDIPFAAIYVANGTGDEAKLCATMLPEGEHLLPEVVLASDNDAHSPWPLASVLRTNSAAECADVHLFGVRFQSGPWPELTRDVLVLPIHAAQDQVSGLLLVGVSSRRPLDAAYRTFFDLVGGHIATAISDARAYEAERKRAEALAELDRAKTAFFSNISHEFRTPLTLMLGPIEDMLSRPDSFAAVDGEDLRLIHRNTLRLLKLVNTLLDFSRIEAGRIEAVYEPTDLAACTTELAGVFRSAIEKTGLKFTVNCPFLPEPVYVDREMWEKIVLNLLSNAFKFTFEGEIEVALRWRGERVELRVADTGVGIPAAEQPHIFERFHRVRDTRARTHEGTGIGLSLVQELVRLHRGDVTFESEEGRGTIFFVSLPTGTRHLRQERIGAERSIASTAMAATSFVEEALRWLPDADTGVGSRFNVQSSMLDAEYQEKHEGGGMNEKTEDYVSGFQCKIENQKFKILFADDNADMRQYVLRLLAGRYMVTAVPDGIAALEAARREPPDLILADVMMPNLDGFGLLRKVRDDARIKDVPVVLLSARAGEESREKGLAGGAEDYLIKPFSARELLARVSARLEIVRVHREALERERGLRTAAEDAEARATLTNVQLLAAQARLESVLASVADTHILFDRRWRYTYVNEAAARAMGWPREQVLGRILWELYPDIVGTELDRQYRRAMEERQLVAFDFYYPTNDSWWANRFFPTPEGIAVFATDISERKRAEQALARVQEELERRVRDRTRELSDLNEELTNEIAERERAEEKLRRSEAYLSEGQRLTKTGSWAWNVSTGEFFWSEQHFRIFALDPAKDTPCYSMALELIHPDDRAFVQQTLERIVRRRSDAEWDCRIIAADGAIKHVHTTAHPVFESGDLIEYVGTTMDITDRKCAAEALQKTQGELARVTRVTTLGELTASIAHEVNQPLAAAAANGNACLRWLARESPDLIEARAAVERLIRDVNRASAVIRRIRTLVTKKDLEKTALDINDTIGEVISLLQSELWKNNVALRTDFSATLPGVFGDRVQLQQVFLNLVLNGIEAMHSVSDRPRELVIGSKRNGPEEVLITVRDAGTGLSPQSLEPIFTAFYTTKPEGLGMGLSVSRSIIQAHGGRLWAAQNEGPGATFLFTLPVAQTS